MSDRSKFPEPVNNGVYFFENMHYSLLYDLGDIVELIDNTFSPLEIAIVLGYLEYIE
jgi:hypothetical protein